MVRSRARTTATTPQATGPASATRRGSGIAAPTIRKMNAARTNDATSHTSSSVRRTCTVTNPSTPPIRTLTVSVVTKKIVASAAPRPPVTIRSATTKMTRLVPSLRRLSPSTSVRSRSGAASRRKVATTAAGAVAQTMAPTSRPDPSEIPVPRWTTTATTSAVRITPGTASTTTRETAHRKGSSGVRNDASKIRPGRSTASTRSGVIPRGASGRTNPAARPRRTRPTTYGSRIRRATRPTTEAAVTRITKTRMASTGLLCILGVCRLWGASGALAGSRAGIAAPGLQRRGTATGTAPRWPPGIGPRSAATGSRRDAILPGMASRRASDLVGSLVDGLVDHPTRRRGGVFRRALRRQFSRLHDRRRLLAVLLLALAGGIGLAGMFARGELAGVDARAYWAAVRIWLNGGDPYHPASPFMLLLWTVTWAYCRHPLATAVVALGLAFPTFANLDTGNINLVLVLMLWGAQFTGPRTAGLLWALATAMKWVPMVFLPILAPRARLHGVLFLAIAGLLTLATLPLTLVQLSVLFALPRPARLDYLVYLWALVPFVWLRPDPAWFLRPATWRAWAAKLMATGRTWRYGQHGDAGRAPGRAGDRLRAAARSFFGLAA